MLLRSWNHFNAATAYRTNLAAHQRLPTNIEAVAILAGMKHCSVSLSVPERLVNVPVDEATAPALSSMGQSTSTTGWQYGLAPRRRDRG